MYTCRCIIVKNLETVCKNVRLMSRGLKPTEHPISAFLERCAALNRSPEGGVQQQELLSAGPMMSEQGWQLPGLCPT